MKPATEIRVVCCVCGRHIRTIDGGGVEGDSHGYCDECAPKELERIRRELREAQG